MLPGSPAKGRPPGRAITVKTSARIPFAFIFIRVENRTVKQERESAFDVTLRVWTYYFAYVICVQFSQEGASTLHYRSRSLSFFSLSSAWGMTTGKGQNANLVMIFLCAYIFFISPFKLSTRNKTRTEKKRKGIRLIYPCPTSGRTCSDGRLHWRPTWGD